LHATVGFISSLDLGGVDYVSVLTPNYFGKLLNGPALTCYYTAVAEASPKPVLIYVAPGFANGVVVPPATLAELADHPNIAGIKDTSPNLMTDYMLVTGGRTDFMVLSGSLNTIMTTLAFGGSGGVVSAANYLPAECARLTKLWHSGQHTEAYGYYAKLQRLAKASGGKGGVAGVKACMDVLGYCGGNPRRPVPALTESDRVGLRETFARELPGLE
jgi:4-hydroxy-2-oxoglutarate aldolase